MSNRIESSAAAHVRWLLVGAFSPAPGGTLTRVSRHNFTEALGTANLSLSLSVPDRLGADERRSLALHWDSLAVFKLAGVIERVPTLASLRALAEDLGSSDPARRPSGDKAVERIIELVGDGRLAAAVRGALTPAATQPPAPAASTSAGAAGQSAPRAAGGATRPEAAPAQPAGAEAGGEAASTGSAIDRIFSQARTQGAQADRTGAASSVGNFVDAVRRSGGADSGGYSLGTAAARAARRAVEDAVYATAADLLRADAVSAVEAAWRGVKLILDESPREEDLEISLLDVLMGSIPGAIEAALPADRAEWPDAVFVVDPMTDIDRIEAAAELMAGLSVPLVVTPSYELFAQAVQAAGMRKSEDVAKAFGPTWARFRGNELSRWVCVCGNPVVLYAEGQGETKREVLASPVLAAAAMLTASYRETGLFGKVFGPQGALKVPAVHSVKDGPSEAMLPVGLFVPASMQADLAAAGVMALGSAKNTDKVIATTWPTMSASQDAVGLPAQIITGRVVRFALWVRDQIQPQTPEPEIKAVYEQAAGLFLFPGIAEGAFLDASVVNDQNGKPCLVHLDVQVRAALAGTPVRLGFEVQLNT
jgi:type VI secretion system protein ImpC